MRSRLSYADSAKGLATSGFSTNDIEVDSTKVLMYSCYGAAWYCYSRKYESGRVRRSSQ